VGVREACARDVDSMCADAKKKLRGQAQVLKCLVKSLADANDGCQVGGRLACGPTNPGLDS
jgi:hypothetical protein